MIVRWSGTARLARQTSVAPLSFPRFLPIPRDSKVSFMFVIGSARCIFLIVVVLFSLAWTSSVQAGIIVSIENTTAIGNGPDITADVFVAWQDPGGMPSVDIDYASLEFLIVPPGGATSSVAFLNPQYGSHLTDPNYLFAGNSLFATIVNYPALTQGALSSTTNLNDTYSAFDQRNNPGSSVTLSSPSKLLFRLDLHATGIPTGIEDFLIQVQPSGASFLDNNGASIAYSLAAGSLGVVTVSGAAAVPEPATGIMLLLGLGFWAGRRRQAWCRKLIAGVVG